MRWTVMFDTDMENSDVLAALQALGYQLLAFKGERVEVKSD